MTVNHVVRRLDVGSGMPTFLVTLAIAVPLAVTFAMWFASIFEIPFQRHRSWAAWRDVVSARWGERAPGADRKQSRTESDDAARGVPGADGSPSAFGALARTDIVHNL